MFSVLSRFVSFLIFFLFKFLCLLLKLFALFIAICMCGGSVLVYDYIINIYIAGIHLVHLLN